MDFYKIWYTELLTDLKQKRFRIHRSWDLLKNKHTEYAIAMDGIIDIYDDIIGIVESYRKESEKRGIDWGKVPEVIQPDELEITRRKMDTGEIDFE